jgi:hypothetical protein
VLPQAAVLWLVLLHGEWWRRAAAQPLPEALIWCRWAASPELAHSSPEAASPEDAPQARRSAEPGASARQAAAQQQAEPAAWDAQAQPRAELAA